MIAQSGQRAGVRRTAAEQALTRLALQAIDLVESASLDEALTGVAAAAAALADVVVVRVADEESGYAEVRAVQAKPLSLAAEIEATRVSLAELDGSELEEGDELPAAVQRVARRAGATAVLLVPALVSGRLVGTVELMRLAGAFGEAERSVARLAAAQAALAVGAFGRAAGGTGAAADGALALAGEALGASADAERTAEVVARLGAEATAARACLLWRGGDDRDPVVVAAFGVEARDPLVEDAALVARALQERDRVLLEHGPAGTIATVQLGRPPLGALQLLYEAEPTPEQRRALVAFALRAAEALRASDRARELEAELDRTRALLAVVGQAIAQLSLAHTLETAVEQVSERLRVRRVAVYLREGGRLITAAERRLGGKHVEVAEQLLQLALGPFRARGLVRIENAAQDERLRRVRGAIEEAGIEAAHAVPLLAHDDVIGLLAVYPRRGRTLSESDAELLAALAAQLAVAVQNARLHENVERQREEVERALHAEQAASRRLSALYEISRSFAEQLSLQDTLDALARTVVDLLDEVDAAVIRLPNGRGHTLVVQALHTADPRMRPALEALFSRPQTAATAAFGRGEPVVLDVTAAERLGDAHALLVPFLEKGSTAAILPISTQAEVLATLTLLSLDPANPITSETVDTGLSIARQAALAVDNARLYQQQKEFADSMQRSLLPRRRPGVPGLEVAEAYESSARLDVGGDLYDYLEIGDSKLAVVLGDVTGHGIDAAADMAMTKFVFRSLILEHPEPADFLRHANDVVCREVAPGKFVTMLCLTFDAATGEVACACAGHPAPRIVLEDGDVAPLQVSGLALGIEPGERYEEMRAVVEPGTAVVLYTDGVVEARRGDELFGADRLDAFLAAHRELPAEDLARAVLEECRRFGGGELADDCAVIVARRAAPVPPEAGATLAP